MKTSSINARPTPLAKSNITRIATKRKRPVTAAESLAAAGIDLAQVLADLQQVSSVNASRVVKLHDRIAAGEYDVDSARLVDKILASEQQDR